MSTDEKKYGLTPPLSVALPTDAEHRANTAMIEELRRQNTFENASDTQKRYKVLESLQQICDEFVKRVAKEKDETKRNEALIKDARGKVFTYGSFRLGVFGPGSDIDTLIVAPKYVTREDYFKYFPDLLVELAPAGAIADLTVVTDAFVPIIKFEYLGISIDLIFSRIAMLKQLPRDLVLKDSNLLRGLDEKELRSLNGTRVTDEILDLIPEPSTFRHALRTIKLWASRRAVYANIMGFPGGVAWAMLVARVCQLYPKATSATIVNKFFHIMRKWPWPQPVMLKKVESGPLQVRVWNPQLYRSDTFHLMPIITPAYPAMCATYNITQSTMSVILRELQLAADISDLVVVGKRPWCDLFTRHTFFTSDYKYYLAVVSASLTKDAHNVWSGFVESKVRVLVSQLDRHASIALAHPFIKGFERTHRCKDDSEIQGAQQGSLAYLVKGDGNPSDAPGNGSPSPTVVYTTTHYIGLQLEEGSKSVDLAYNVAEFKDLCTAWEKYNKELNSLAIQHVRNTDLPDDVFEPGEVKPQKKSATAKSNRANGVTKAPPNSTTAAADSKKRSAPEDNTPPAKRPATTVAAG